MRTSAIVVVSFATVADFLFPRSIYAGINRLQLAISMCQVDTVRKLIQAGADANGKDTHGWPLATWLASNQRCDDTSALATAMLLSERGVKFETLEGEAKPRLLVKVATRGLPLTLEFLCKKQGSGSATEALHAIARGSDIASIRVLLAAGADPLDGPALSSALFDAAAAGRAASVQEMMKHIGDKQSPKVLAAYEIAKKKNYLEVAQIFLDAGAKPPEPVHKNLPCQRHELSSAQVELLTQLGLPNPSRLSGIAGSMSCKLVQECGELALIDCNSAADGPAYYVDQKAKRLLATCGGACMHGCTGCPPKEWTCECKF